VRLKRKGSRVTVTWRPARFAARYVVRAKLSDGRSLVLFATAKKRTVRLSGLASSARGTVSVAGLKPDGTTGTAARVKLAPRKRR
jgi:hypothetical protein